MNKAPKVADGRKREGRQVGIGGRCVHCGSPVMAMGREWRRHYEQSKKWGYLKGQLKPGAHCPRCKVPYIPDGVGPKT